MDKAEERKAQWLQTVANHESLSLHPGEAVDRWLLTPVPDPLPRDYQPTRTEQSIGFASLCDVDRYLKAQAPR